MHKLNRRATLLRSGMGCFLFAAVVTAANVLILPYARRYYGYPALGTYIAFAAATALFSALGRYLRGCDEARIARAKRIALPLFLAVMFVIQTSLGYWMAYTPSGDNHMLIDGAKMLAADGNFSKNPDFSLYLSRFSNQWGFLLMLTGIFKLFGALGLADFLFPLAVIQAALYTAGFCAALSIARDMRGSRGALMLMALLACCPPVYLAAAVLYTDTFSLPFVLFTLYAAHHVLHAKCLRTRLCWAGLCAVFALVGSQIKMTVLIVLLAAGIVWLLSMRPRHALLCAGLCAVIVAAGMGAMQHVMLEDVLDPAVVRQQHTPAVHWVMMSIPTGDNPYGSMNNGDYALTWGMMDEGATREEVTASILERMKDRIYTLRYPNRLVTAALRKNANAFGDGTFGMTEMLDDGPLRENMVSAFVLEGRSGYAAYSAICSGIYLAILVFAALGCLSDIRSRDLSAATLYVAMFGMMLFLMLWEARSRYAFGFVPVLLLLCCFYLVRGYEPKRSAKLPRLHYPLSYRMNAVKVRQGKGERAA